MTESTDTARRELSSMSELGQRLQAIVYDIDTLDAFAERAAAAFRHIDLPYAAERLDELRAAARAPEAAPTEATARRLELAERLRATVRDADSLGAFAARAAGAFNRAGLNGTAHKLRELRLREIVPGLADKAAAFDALVDRLHRASLDAVGEVTPNYWRAAIWFVCATAAALDDYGRGDAAGAVRVLADHQIDHADACERDGLLRRVERGQATAADAARLRELFEGRAVREVNALPSCADRCAEPENFDCELCDDCVAPGHE